MGHPTESPEELLHDYPAVWNEGDYAMLQDVVSSDFVLVDPGAPDGKLAGRDTVESYLRELRTGFPDLQISMSRTLTNDETIMAEWTATGRHDGEFNGVPPTHRRIEFRGMDMISVADGRIREHRVYYDLQEMLDQLGLTFPTVIGQLPKLAWRKLTSSAE